MTDAQHAARLAAQETSATIRDRIARIVQDNPGSTFACVAEEYQDRHGAALEEPTAVGRLSELADGGIVYVSGKKKVGRRTLPRYYYEPDPNCRFRISIARENEKFLRWLRAADQFAERLPGYLRDGLRGHAALLADTMEMARENREG